MAKTALVTGCSSGIGYETALELARRGYSTYAGVRDTAKDGGLGDAAAKGSLDVRVISMDVDDESASRAAVDSVLAKGSIDVLVNNAGYGLFGSLEDVAVDDLKSQFETNFFSIVRTIQQVAPSMRKSGSGCIVNVSSIVGRMGVPGTSAYTSSKFALEGLSECLRYELGQFGIRTVIIEPGVTKTRFFDSMRLAKPADSQYSEITDKVVSGLKMMAQLGTNPAEVARKIADVTAEEDPLPRYVVGTDAAMFDESRRSKTDVEFENYLKAQLFS